MKTTFTIFLSLFGLSTLFSQSLPLPYYTGFDSSTEQDGWQEFRTGFESTYGWEDLGQLSHDYNVGGNPTDTVIDWYVSPPLEFVAPGTVTMKVKTGGFSTPTPNNCEVWFGTNDPNPLTGDFVLIGNLSYMQPQSQWIDTLFDIPFTTDSGYVAFKYTTIGAEWVTYAIDSITVSIPADPIGINEIESNNTTLVPNPFVSNTTLYFDSEIENGQLDIYNSNGQKVRSLSNINGNQYQLERGNLPAGIYLMHVSQNSKVITTKKISITD